MVYNTFIINIETFFFINVATCIKKCNKFLSDSPFLKTKLPYSRKE